MPPKKTTKGTNVKGVKAKSVSSKASAVEKAAGPSNAATKEKSETTPVTQINLSQLASVVFQDEGNKITESGKWPLLLDPDTRSSTFLRYRDVNYIDMTNPVNMIPDNIRQAILGSIRWHKPLVLDMTDAEDGYEKCKTRFEEVQEGLMQSIMDKSILQEDMFRRLIKNSDAPEYQDLYSSEGFQFILVTQRLDPPASLLKQTYPIQINV